MAGRPAIHLSHLVTRNLAFALDLTQLPVKSDPYNPRGLPSHIVIVIVNEVGDIVYDSHVQLPDDQGTAYTESASTTRNILQVKAEIIALVKSVSRYQNRIVYWDDTEDLDTVGLDWNTNYMIGVHVQHPQRLAYIEDHSLGEKPTLCDSTREFLGFNIGEGHSRRLVEEARATMALYQLWMPGLCATKMARSRITES